MCVCVVGVLFRDYNGELDWKPSRWIFVQENEQRHTEDTVCLTQIERIEQTVGLESAFECRLAGDGYGVCEVRAVRSLNFNLKR